MSSIEKVDARFSAADVAVNEFDHMAWEAAVPVRLSRYWSGQIAPESRHAEARLIWTPNALLVRFSCNQREPMVINASPDTKTKTLGLWDRDVCELFISPDLTRPNRYFEFEAAPTGEWIDLAILKKDDGRETDWDYSSGMTTASRIESEILTTVIRVPWSNTIPKPAKGDEWAVNLCRCLGGGEGRGYLAWQATRTEKPNFHVPAAFARLRFV